MTAFLTIGQNGDSYVNVANVARLNWVGDGQYHVEDLRGHIIGITHQVYLDSLRFNVVAASGWECLIALEPETPSENWGVIVEPVLAFSHNIDHDLIPIVTDSLFNNRESWALRHKDSPRVFTDGSGCFDDVESWLRNCKAEKAQSEEWAAQRKAREEAAEQKAREEA
jgi:hypothetical protein